MKNLLLAIAAFACTAHAFAERIAYPDTPKRPVLDTYHGVAVTDNYRWLEDDRSPDVKRWLVEENQLTRRYLDNIGQRADIAKRVANLYSAEPVSRYAFQFRSQLFAMKRQPPKNQPILVVLPPDGDTAKERVVLDPTHVDSKGRTTIDFCQPSFDGKLVVVSLSENGSEDGTAYVYEVATGRRRPDVVPHVTYPTAGGSVEWLPDGSGFYYTRFPQENERPPEDRHFYQQVWFHRLGTPNASDRYVIGRAFPRIAEVSLHASRDGRYLLAQVRNGDGGEVAFHVRQPDGRWNQVSAFNDGIKQAAIGDDGKLYAVSIKDAPLGRIIAIPLASPSLANARVVVAETDIVAENIVPARSRLYVAYRVGGPSIVRIFDLAGKPLGELPTEPNSDNAIGARLRGDFVLVRTTSYVSPTAWFRYDAGSGKRLPTQLAGRYPFDLDDADVTREYAVSKDGTRVPVNIVARKGTPRDGRNPTILYGYGGYGSSMPPYFSPLTRLWLDYGGIYAVANVRGGGEFGEPWHEAGKLTRKQNVFDDFIASMRFLVDRNYTTPERLAIMGASNGGLLMGAALTQQPQAMRAVVSSVGIYDALRWELQPNGEFNTTEFGSVKDPEQFTALYAYSPFNNARDGVAYPAVLFTAGDNDGRVAPYESRKMTARLQAATSSEHPILLRTEATAGHGVGTARSTMIEEKADIYAFLIDQLGIAGPAAAGATR